MLVNCVLYRSAAELARMAADVDRMSGGRHILGLGIGIDDQEFSRLGLTMPGKRTLRQVAQYADAANLAPAASMGPMSAFTSEDITRKLAVLERTAAILIDRAPRCS